MNESLWTVGLCAVWIAGFLSTSWALRKSAAEFDNHSDLADLGTLGFLVMCVFLAWPLLLALIALGYLSRVVANWLWSGDWDWKLP